MLRDATRVEHIMGMPIELDVRDPVGEDAIEAVWDGLRIADDVFSTYRPDSDISRLGRGELRIADCRPEVDDVLTRCARLNEETGGFFSVRAGGDLDPSGLVKGWAVQRAADTLLAAGARNFFLNAGGDVVVRGAPEPGELWRVGIRHPVAHDKVAAVLEVTDLAVATSGEYERGEHVLDPHTGRPPAGLVSVTVVGPDLGTADAYATAIFAMGAAGPDWALRLNDYEALCITDDRRVLSTPGMERHRLS